MRLLDADQVGRLLDMPLALDAARSAAALEAQTDRMELHTPNGWIRFLAGSIAALDVVGYKEFHMAGQTVTYRCHVFRLSTGESLGVVDASHITGYRTSATAAVALRSLVGGGDVRVGVVGTGHEARQGLRALRASGGIEHAIVFSRQEDNRRSFADELGAELGVDITPVGDVREVLRGVDLVYAVTNSHGQVVLQPDMIGDLPVLATVGSTLPSQRETAGAVFHRAATVIVDTKDALTSSGDMVEALQIGPLRDLRLLSDHLATGRPVGDGFVIYKSIGSAEQDLVLAARLLERAAETGEGQEVAPIGRGRVMPGPTQQSASRR